MCYAITGLVVNGAVRPKCYQGQASDSVQGPIMNHHQQQQQQQHQQPQQYWLVWAGGQALVTVVVLLPWQLFVMPLPPLLSCTAPV
jgi:hypothetical protein